MSGIARMPEVTGYGIGANSAAILPAVRHGNAAGFPRVQGRCPACRGASLFLGADGYVTCSRLDCTDPSAASTALGITWPDLDPPDHCPDAEDRP